MREDIEELTSVVKFKHILFNLKIERKIQKTMRNLI